MQPDAAVLDRPATGGEPVLEVSGVRKAFPGVLALDDVDMKVRAGSVHALMGENGAGKSTLIKILAGAYSKDAGTITIGGKQADIRSPRDALDLGIKVVFQEISLIPEFSVAENIALEDLPVDRLGSLDWRRIRREAAALFDQVGFAIDPAARTGDLPISQQQMVEIARAVSQQARIVVMDEPTSSLTPTEIKLLFDVIKRLTSMGMAVIYVSHKLEEVFEIADTVTVLRDGKLISSLPIEQHDHASLIEHMVGRTIEDLYPRTREHTIGDTVLEVDGLKSAKLRDVSLTARAGEVIGFFGLMGAGRTELAKAIVGYDRVDAGSVRVEGQELRPHNPARAVELGIGLLTEDRKEEGLVLGMSVMHNMSLASLSQLSHAGFIDDREERKQSTSFVDRFRVRTPSIDRQVRNLSGGNQQKVVLSRWLMRGLKVIILDEPTRGIDIGAKTEIFSLIDELAAQGLAVLLMTSEMPELLGLSDRIMVMANGHVAAEMAREDANQEAILNAAIG
ncbi:MAG: sugar ABC transporter ATP-binding protein [Pseudomonadota bacterium]